MNYELAAERYINVRNAIDKLEREHKAAKAELAEKLAMLENWFTAKAQEDGLDSIKTSYGTGYWSTHHTATVASREEFFGYCKENDTWDSEQGVNNEQRNYSTSTHRRPYCCAPASGY